MADRTTSFALFPPEDLEIAVGPDGLQLEGVNSITPGTAQANTTTLRAFRGKRTISTPGDIPSIAFGTTARVDTVPGFKFLLDAYRAGTTFDTEIRLPGEVLYDGAGTFTVPVKNNRLKSTVFTETGKLTELTVAGAATDFDFNDDLYNKGDVVIAKAGAALAAVDLADDAAKAPIVIAGIDTENKLKCGVPFDTREVLAAAQQKFVIARPALIWKFSGKVTSIGFMPSFTADDTSAASGDFEITPSTDPALFKYATGAVGKRLYGV